VSVRTRDGQHAFEIVVHFAGLDPDALRVELYAAGVAGTAPTRLAMNRLRQVTSPSSGYVYGAAVSTARPAGDYTARVIPHGEEVAIPLEDPRILWQR
jgi:starch phosphorylase